jgi:hypothetical protein
MLHFSSAFLHGLHRDFSLLSRHAFDCLISSDFSFSSLLTLSVDRYFVELQFASGVEGFRLVTPVWCWCEFPPIDY